MAYIYAPTIDNTVTAYDIDSLSAIDTENANMVLNIPFFLNNASDTINQNWVLVRIEDAYGNSWFNDKNAVHAFKYEQDTLLSTIYNVGTGINQRYNIQIPITALNVKEFQIGDYCHIFLKLLAKGINAPTSMTWDAWLNTHKDYQSAWSDAGVRYFVKTPSIEFKQKQSRLWHYIGTSVASENFYVPILYKMIDYNDENGDGKDDGIDKEYTAIQIPDAFIEYRYQARPSDGEIVPVLYATDMNKYPTEAAYNNTFYYDGTFNYQGVDYDSWRQIENKDFTWDSAHTIHVLTQRIVTNNMVDTNILSPLTVFPGARPQIRAEFTYGTEKLETDSIEWCRFHLKQDEEEFDSGRLYPIAKNTIEWQVPVQFTQGKIYYTYKTRKGYINIVAENDHEALVYVCQTTSSIDPPSVNVAYDKVASAATKFTITQSSAWNPAPASAIFNLERAPLNANTPDDVMWDLVMQKTVKNLDQMGNTFDIIDKTCQLGVPYQYRYFWSTESGNSSTPVQISQSTSDAIMHISEDILLTTKDREVIVRFNPELTGLKYNFKDAITPTLGRRYPFMYRNRKQNYRTFTLGGMISYEAQPNWNDSSQITNIMNNSASAHEQQIITERMFRDGILQFLEAGNVILFRSLQEGNMFIHLSNIQLKSEKALGRMIYSFSATATEVCEANSDNYLKYFKETDVETPIEARILYAVGTQVVTDTDAKNVRTLYGAEGEGDSSSATWTLYHTTVQE